jgi:hypothetical protein
MGSFKHLDKLSLIMTWGNSKTEFAAVVFKLLMFEES